MPVAVALAVVLTTTIAATALGSWLRGAGFGIYHPAERWAIRTGIGFLILSNTLVALARLRLVAASQLTVLFGVLTVFAGAWIMFTVLRLRAGQRTPSTAPDTSRATMSPRSCALMAAAIAYAAWVVMVASLPAAGVDELIHHLAVAKQMLEAGGDIVALDNIYAFFPPLGDMFFLFGLGVGGETTARLFHAALTVVLAAAVFGFARRHLSAGGSAAAVAVFLSVPSVMVIMPLAYVDLMFALYTFLAFVLLAGFLETRQTAWIVLSGVMAGGAVGVKYTGIQITLLLTLVLLVDHAVARRRGMPWAAAILPGISLVMALPFLWRNLSITGWPLFPFPIGDAPVTPGINWDGERASMFLALLASYGSSTDPIGPASAWDAVISPVRVFVAGAFNDPRRYDGVVGPVFLLVPFAFAAVRRVPALAAALLFSAMFLLYWGLTVRQVRFLIPVVPILSVLLIVVVSRWRPSVGYALVAAAVLPSLVIGMQPVLVQDPWRYWSGAESREAFLERNVPGYAMYYAANQRLGTSDRVYLINMGNYGYYLDPEWRSDFVFETHRLEPRLSAADSEENLASFFRTQGITHVLVDERLTYEGAGLSPEQRSRLERFLTEHGTVVIESARRVLYSLNLSTTAG